MVISRIGLGGPDKIRTPCNRRLARGRPTAARHLFAGCELTVNLFLDQERRGQFQVKGPGDDVSAMAAKTVSQILRAVGEAAGARK